MVAAVAMSRERRPMERRSFVASGLALLGGGWAARHGAGPTGAAIGRRHSFDEIDVQRINVVEPDGTPRLAIFNRAREPQLFIKGKERHHPNRPPFGGLLFFNDEGTECGGLGFGGKTDPSGKVHSSGGLSFDQYMQDEMISISADYHDGVNQSQIIFSDRPRWSIVEELDADDRVSKLPSSQQAAEWDKFFANHPKPQDRLVVGREQDGAVAIKLRDAQGQDRLVLKVDSAGRPSLKFYDEHGTTAQQLP